MGFPIAMIGGDNWRWGCTNGTFAAASAGTGAAPAPVGGMDVMRAQLRHDGNCVEIAELANGIVLRDSKYPTGPVLAVARHEWCAFLSGTKTGQFG